MEDGLNIILEPEESNLPLEFDFSKNNNENFEGSESEQLQRTEKWQEERKGRWTGSMLKQLMACTPKGGKMSWIDNTKFLEVSKGALKYMFANAMERKTGRYIETSSTYEMRYGTAVEPFITKRANELLKIKGLFLEDVGFKTFPNIETAGVSSDKLVKKFEGNKLYATAEMKACCSWSSLYDRTHESMNDKSGDFWQTQSQMLAWEVKEAFYIVATPPKDIKKYINSEENDLELYEEWCNDTELIIQNVKISKIHLSNLVKRILIGEKVVERFLEEDGSNIKGILDDVLHEEKNIFVGNSKEEKESNIIENIKVEFDVIEPIEKELESNIKEEEKEEDEDENEDFKNVPF